MNPSGDIAAFFKNYIMAYKALIQQVAASNFGLGLSAYIDFGVYDSVTGDYYIEGSQPFSTVGINNSDDFRTAAIAAFLVWVSNHSTYSSMTEDDIVWSSVPAKRVFNNAPGATIQTSTGAVGTQISATRDAMVSYSPTMQTTASIAGSASDVIVLEICPTNSATAGDWVEIARVTNAQALSLAIALQSVQTTSGVLSGIVPAGYYRKLRAITSGTVSNSMSSGQEVLLG